MIDCLYKCFLSKKTVDKETQTELKVTKNSQATETFEFSYECSICMNNSIDVYFIPCSHANVCEECSQKISKCPICMKNIEEKKKLFINH